MDDNVLQIILRLQDELGPALAKAQQTIRDASGQLAGMTSAVKESNQTHLDFIGTLKEVGAAFGIAFSLEAAVEFMKSILEGANALNTLSIQTRISVEDLQILQSATKEYGVEGDSLSRALFQLSQRIARGDDSVAAAYALMGYSIDQVRGKNAIDLFMVTERGLGTLQGAIQDAAAADLYGGKLGASMVAFSTGSDEAIAKARELNTVASKESVQALADYQNAIDRVSASMKAFVTQQVGAVAMGFNVLTKAVGDGAGKWDVFVAFMKDFDDKLLGTGSGTEHLATLLDQLSGSADKGALAIVAATGANKDAKVALDAHGQAAAAMAALELNSSKPILDYQVQYLQQLDAMGKLDAQHALAIGVDAQQLGQYIAQKKADADALRILADIDQENDASQTQYYQNRMKQLAEISKASLSAYSFGAQIAALEQLDAAEQVLAVQVEHSMTSEADRAKVRADAAKAHLDIMNQELDLQKKQALVVNAAQQAEIDAQTKLNAEWGLNAMGAINVQKTALDRLNLALDDLHTRRVILNADTGKYVSQAAQEKVLTDAYTASLYAESMAEDAVIQAMVSKASETAAAMESDRAAAAAAENAFLGYKNSISLTSTSLDDLNAKLASAYDALAKVGPLGINTGSGIGTFSGKSAQQLWSPASTDALLAKLQTRDTGGPVMPNQPYLIGRGAQPELFVPNSPGMMVPAGGYGGGGTTLSVAIHVTQPLASAGDIADAVLPPLTQRLRQMGVKF